uniref:Uncharacterized protein n=1 Tax=Chelonoidis abingdonii TaxID=106734 RepID=A0A8C0IT72_CHEAB
FLALEVIEENITAGTEYGLKMQELLFGGQNIPEELITKMILKKIESPEVAHFGYVLSGFPSLSEEYMTISEQIEKIRNLKLKPNFLINLKCPDYDLCQRLSGQRQHPDTGQIYQRNQWDPEIIDKRKKKRDQHKGEDEEEEEEEEQEEEDEAAADAIMLSDILPHLVQRPEDFLENAEARVNLYKDTMLYPLEVRTAQSNIVDELFRTLSSFKIIAPRYRWCRSRWGRACPVALKEGNIVMGLPDLAVSFLGKMYLFSSQEALREFMLNPRPYLLPPMPLPPCKVVVFGPPLSGKTTLCNWIANKYKGKVEDTSINTSESEVTADHPQVQALVEEAVKIAAQSPIMLPAEVYAEALEEAITELIKKNNDRFPGAPEKGGWVLDNYPTTSEHWLALSEKGLLPDTVVCLKNIEKNGTFLLHRLYITNKDEINSKILERLTDEALKKQKEEEETRRELQEVLKLKEENQQPIKPAEDHDESKYHLI